MLLCGSGHVRGEGGHALLLQGLQVSAWPVRVAWTGQPLPLMLTASLLAGVRGELGLWAVFGLNHSRLPCALG